MVQRGVFRQRSFPMTSGWRAVDPQTCPNFRLFQHDGHPPFWILKILIFNHVTVIAVLTCCCVPHFIKIVSRVRPQLQNVQCAVARQRPLPWQPNRGWHVEDMMGCDHPSWVSVGPLVGELWHFEYFPTWRPSAILNFKKFNILSRDCRSGPNMLLCTKFYQNWFTRSASRRP